MGPPPGEGPAASPYAPSPAPRRRGIGWPAVVLVVVAALSLALALPLRWAPGRVTDRDLWDEVVVPLHRDREVVELIADEVVDTLEDDLVTADPDDLHDAVTDIVRRRSFARAWRRAVHQARRDLVAVVDGEGREAVLRLKAVVDELKEDPRFADDLANVTTVTVTIVRPIDSDEIHDRVGSARAASIALVVVGLVSSAAAIALARRRWRAGAVLGVTVAAGQILVAVLVVAGRGPIARAFVDRPFEGLATDIAGQVTGGLVTQAFLVGSAALLLGGASALIAFVRHPRTAPPAGV